MKDFQLQLNTPPNGVYFPGMTVTGTVFTVNKIRKDYKAIKVTIVGFAHVYWTESHRSGRHRHTESYISHKEYLNTFVYVWDKNTAGDGGKFPAGNYQFPFSLQLVGNNLPASYEGTVGQIRYTIEARVIQGNPKKRDIVSETTINVVNVVEINHPDLLQPRSMELQKMLCCWCCISGPIVITTNIPRTGYCIQGDCIPMDISVENGSSRDIRQVVVSIHKLVQYTARGRYRFDRIDVATVASEPVLAHNTMVWKPLPLAVPDTPATSVNCGILQVNYFLRVTAAITCANNPSVDIPLVLGNMPTVETETGPQSTILPQQQELEPRLFPGVLPQQQQLEPHLIPGVLPQQQQLEPYPIPGVLPQQQQLEPHLIQGVLPQQQQLEPHPIPGVLPQQQQLEPHLFPGAMPPQPMPKVYPAPDSVPFDLLQ